MDYRKGYVYELMDQGGPTSTKEPYFKEAVDEMMRSRTLCAKANACRMIRHMYPTLRNCLTEHSMMSEY